MKILIINKMLAYIIS